MNSIEKDSDSGSKECSEKIELYQQNEQNYSLFYNYRRFFPFHKIENFSMKAVEHIDYEAAL